MAPLFFSDAFADETTGCQIIMKFKFNSLPKRRLSLTLFGAILSTPAAHAVVEVKPGQTYIVGPDDSVKDYRVSGGTLIVRENSKTGSIEARSGSTVRIDRGHTASTGHALILGEASTATVNDSVIIGGDGAPAPGVDRSGIALNGTQNGSHVYVTNSDVSGIGRGINVAGNSNLVLDGTHVTGHAGGALIGPIRADLGIGVFVAGSGADLRNGSSVTGDYNGVMMIAAAPPMGQWGQPYVSIDGSTVTGTQSSALLVSGRDATDFTFAQIDVKNGSSLVGGNGVILEVQNAAGARFNVDDSRLVGDIVVSDGSTADMNLNNSASLTGNIRNASSLNIDSSSQWVMEGDSSVANLGLSGGTVDLRGTTPGFHTLTVGELSGTGTFALGTDLATRSGDFLDITGNATGNHQLLVHNSGINPDQGAEPLQVVHTGSGDAQFSLVGEKVDFGTFAYQLESGQNGTGGSDWSLVQTGDLSAGSRSVMGLFSAAPTVWYGESATLRSRMGELRNGHDQGGGWIRSYGNKYYMSAGGGVAYKQVQHGISFGADAPLPSSDGQWLVGLMGGYSKSDLDLQHGTSGTVDSYYVGAYSTWLSDDGLYVDALIKANRFQNASDVTMRDGAKSKGKYSNHGVGASVEAGKHIKLEDEWFVEPFAQVSGLLVSGQNYELDNGMRASSNKADSLLGKTGTYLGRSFTLEDGGFVQPYVKAAAAHEFVSGNRVNINGDRFTNDLSGSRIEVGTGVAAQLNDVLQLHADFDYMKGRNIEQPWGVNVGLRYIW